MSYRLGQKGPKLVTEARHGWDAARILQGYKATAMALTAVVVRKTQHLQMVILMGEFI